MYTPVPYSLNKDPLYQVNQYQSEPVVTDNPPQTPSEGNPKTRSENELSRETKKLLEEISWRSLLEIRKAERAAELEYSETIIDLIKQQIQLRRQIIFDELDVLDKDERSLSDPKIAGIVERYKGYLK